MRRAMGHSRGAESPENMNGKRDTSPPADRLMIARALREMATLLEVTGREPFRARAYTRGAEALERLDADLARLVEERRLTELSGIGPGLAAMIAELYHTGRALALEEQRRRVPALALALRRIPRLGLTKISALQDALGVETIEDLETACEAGRVRTVKGMGEKTERLILEHIRRLREPAARRVLLPEALAAAEAMRAHLSGAAGAREVEIAGELRRWMESVDSLSLVVASDRQVDTLNAGRRAPLLADVTSADPTGFKGRR